MMRTRCGTRQLRSELWWWSRTLRGDLAHLPYLWSRFAMPPAELGSRAVTTAGTRSRCFGPSITVSSVPGRAAAIMPGSQEAATMRAGQVTPKNCLIRPAQGR
jgi:hypothetical protein